MGDFRLEDKVDYTELIPLFGVIKTVINLNKGRRVIFETDFIQDTWPLYAGYLGLQGGLLATLGHYFV